MKFFKAGIALLLACAMLTGCGKKSLTEEEMKALLQETQTNMASVESGHIALDGTLNMSGDMLADSGMDNTEMTMTLDMQYKDMTKQTIGLAGNFSIGVLGMNMTGNLYIKDEAMYIDLLGQKMKTSLDLSALSLVSEPANVDVSMLTNWTYEEKDGKTYIDCDIASDYFESVLKDIEDDSMTFKANQLHCRYGITDDKYFAEMAITMDIEMTMEGQSVAYTGQINMIWDEHNQVSEITYPDFSDYVETEESLTDPASTPVN